MIVCVEGLNEWESSSYKGDSGEVIFVKKY